MKTLRVDDKWSIEYDPDFNDKPSRVLRYGKPMEIFDWTNDVTAMFYALLERDEHIAELGRLTDNVWEPAETEADRTAR